MLSTLQDTLLAAWQGLAEFEGRASIHTWLYRIATNQCLNALRSAKRRPAKEWDVPGVEPPEVSTHALRIRGLRRRGGFLRSYIRRGPEVRPRANEGERSAGVRSLPACPYRHQPRGWSHCPHPHRRANLRYDPLRKWRTPVVRATAIASEPIAGSERDLHRCYERASMETTLRSPVEMTHKSAGIETKSLLKKQ
jgi:hypothetical protein